MWKLKFRQNQRVGLKPTLDVNKKNIKKTKLKKMLWKLILEEKFGWKPILAASQNWTESKVPQKPK